MPQLLNEYTDESASSMCSDEVLFVYAEWVEHHPTVPQQAWALKRPYSYSIPFAPLAPYKNITKTSCFRDLLSMGGQSMTARHVTFNINPMRLRSPRSTTGRIRTRRKAPGSPDPRRFCLCPSQRWGHPEKILQTHDKTVT